MGRHDRPRAVPHHVRERDLTAETNARRKRRFGDPSDGGAPGRGRKDWPQLREHLAANIASHRKPKD